MIGHFGDIPAQSSSLQEALPAVGRGLLRNHLRRCAKRNSKRQGGSDVP
jgi:DNA-binding FrmR family transcriptional regulator